MSEYGWISIISLVGWLILGLGAYRSYRIGARKTVVLALIWGAIFVGLAILFGAILT